MLKINQLCVDYGNTRVVDQLDLALGDDEILMLVGPTGCGKTTILQAVAGLVPISAGDIALNGWRATPSNDVAPEKRNVGMVFQDFALFPHLTVEQNVAFRLDDRAPAHHWLELLGLAQLKNAKPGRLSGGQKQRVALARALAHGPSLMLLDEPLSNLDAALKDSLRWEIRNALKAAGVPAIWVTHDQGEALSVGDRLGILYDGKLAQLDTPERCFAEPADRFVARFMGETSYIPGQLAGNSAHTALGVVPVKVIGPADAAVEVMLRPDDCDLAGAAPDGGNGAIAAAQFEGGSWLYTVALDPGPRISVRTGHENRLQVNERVALTVTSTQPLAAFAAAAH
jgi:iron(III) transport system ATP-binding protein